MNDWVSQKLAKKEKILTIVWWGIALGLVMGCSLNSISGFDWIYFYYPRAHNFTPETIVNPMWLYFLLMPIASFPVRLSYGLFSLINVSLIWLGSRLTKVNRFALLLSFPSLWILWYGQIDALAMIGAALGFWAIQHRKSALLGLALLLLLVKPHIGGPLAVAYFLWSRNWRVLAIFGAGVFMSLLVWGFDWPIIWFRNLYHLAVPPDGATVTMAGQKTNISLYPLGLLAWLIVLLPGSRVERAIAVVAATILSVPYAAAYSLIVLLVLPIPWWVYLLSSIPLVLGPEGYWFTTLAPLACLGWITIKWWAGLRKNHSV